MRQLITFFIMLCFTLPTYAQIKGALSIDNLNLSGLVVTEHFIAVASDERSAIQILPRSGDHFIAQASGKISLLNSPTELDLEGLAWQSPYLYAIGSHSLKRKKMKVGLSVNKNIKRMSKRVREQSREWLFRIQLNDQYQPVKIDRLSLRSVLKDNPIIAPFLQIPSKENGVDIEGIAIQGKHLYLGFRGPILRQGQVPILRLTLKKNQFIIKKTQWLWVNLQGLGIRDMVTTTNGITLLGGPMNALPQHYALFHWYGKSHLSPLAPFYTLKQFTGKPEGLGWDGHHYWLVQDGLPNGNLHPLPISP